MPHMAIAANHFLRRNPSLKFLNSLTVKCKCFQKIKGSEEVMEACFKEIRGFLYFFFFFFFFFFFITNKRTKLGKIGIWPKNWGILLGISLCVQNFLRILGKPVKSRNVKEFQDTGKPVIQCQWVCSIARTYHVVLSQNIRKGYFSHRRPGKAQMSLRISAVSPEPLALADIGSMGKLAKVVWNIPEGCNWSESINEPAREKGTLWFSGLWFFKYACAVCIWVTGTRLFPEAS